MAVFQGLGDENFRESLAPGCIGEDRHAGHTMRDVIQRHTSAVFLYLAYTRGTPLLEDEANDHRAEPRRAAVDTNTFCVCPDKVADFGVIERLKAERRRHISSSPAWSARDARGLLDRGGDASRRRR